MIVPTSLLPIIFGCGGTVLSAEEAAFFRDANPAGFILFQKNCADPEQLRALVDALRNSVGWNAPVLIDQEGGRVQRLKRPSWRGDFPAMRPFGERYKTDRIAATDALKANVAALAAAQCPHGIDVDCIPVLDVVPDENKVRAIDDRSFGSDPQAAGALGLAAVHAALDAGMTPVIKHIPGHGRATVDSHHDLPCIAADLEILRKTDFVPFRVVASGTDNARLWGMSAHVIYTAIDPDLPATLSPTVIAEIVRGEIGFGGLLLSDDLFMDALAPFGDVPERARRCVAAGMDIALHCHGDVAAMTRAADSVGVMRPETRARMDVWLKKRPVYASGKPLDILISQVQDLLSA